MGDEILDAGLIAIGSCRGDPNNVDVAGATARGIPVLHAPGRNADGVAEIAIALTLAATRWVVPADRDLRAGAVFRDDTIPYQRYRAWQLAGRTVGIVGLGAVGRAAAWRFAGLGMDVISFDPFNPEATHDSLDALLGEADVVSMHAAVTPDTLRADGRRPVRRHARRCGVRQHGPGRPARPGRADRRRCGPGSCPRPGWTTSTASSCPTATRWPTMDNVVLTPHIGGATYDTEVNHSAMLAEDIARILAGERPLHCVNPEVLP